MGNTLNALCPRCNESEESHPHFIFHCKLSQTTLTFINRLINRNYKFQSPYKINITDVLMASFDRTHEDIKLEIFPTSYTEFIQVKSPQIFQTLTEITWLKTGQVSFNILLIRFIYNIDDICRSYVV